MLYLPGIRVTSLATVLAAALLIGSTATGLTVGTDLFPMQGTRYDSTNGVFFPAANANLIGLSMIANNPGGSPTPPIGHQFSVDSFFDITYEIDMNNPAGTPPETIDIELVQLDLVSVNPLPGGGPPPQLRESPTRPSSGQLTIVPVAGGDFQVDSFFDIWYEVSLDGGTSWEPSAQSMHMVLSPEPSSALLLGLGLAGTAVARRRRARHSA